MKSFKFGIRTRLILLTMLSILPVFILMMFHIKDDYQRKFSDLQSDATAIADLTANNFEEYIESTKQTLNVLALSKEVRELNTSGISSLFENVKKKCNYYNNIGLTDSAGLNIASAIKLTSPVYSNDKPWFKRLQNERKFVIGDFQIGKLTKKPGINMALPLNNLPESSTLPAIYVAMNLDYFQNLLANIKLPPDGVINLIDRNGVILARNLSAESYIGRISGAWTAFIFNNPNNEKFVEVLGIDSISRLYRYIHVPKSNGSLLIGIGVSKKYLEKQTNEILINDFFGLICCLAGAVILAWIISKRSVIKQIDILANASKKIAAGDKDVLVEINSGAGELQQLATVFNEMIASVKKYSEQMEFLVNERTNELNNKNLTLELVIEEKKITELALSQSEEKYRNIVETSLVGVFRSNVQGDILYVNNSVLKTFEFSSFNEIKSKGSLFAYKFPEQRDRLMELLKQNGKVENYETSMLTSNGNDKFVLMSIVLNDNILDGTLIDITDRKEAEEKLKNLYNDLVISKENIEINLYENNSLLEAITQSEANLKETLAVKDKFFSIIAHDLKSPFSGFLGITKLFADNISDISIHELKELSINMKDSADNLYKLLENLLEWSRMQRGITEFEPDLWILFHIVNENIYLLNEFAKQKNIKIYNKIPEKFEIAADYNMINTVFRNLISNAIKFTHRGGEIEIGISSFNSDSHQKIYVKDSGIGINDELKGKLFKIDERVSRKGTENEPSTGLGLLLCKEYIEKYNGKIWLESEVDNGTTFYFTLT
ncbi:MAG: ATP-binding protein [Candidatus Kapabacteria bacterium]|nr:ATP-binding protein [Candidatus Kapabacteria bacterium]